MIFQIKKYFKQFVIGAFIAAFGAGTYVIAAVTFTDFTDGTTISASEMNDKLNALKNAVNANCPPSTSRFTDNGDGTICDGQTGLMWEIKTGTAGTPVVCSTPTTCPDPHNVNNTYTWSVVMPNPDGTLFTDFLKKVNDLEDPNDGVTTTCFAGHCDWRIASVGELRSLLPEPFPNCATPCIAAGFPGNIASSFYLSSSTNASSTTQAYVVNFSQGAVTGGTKGAGGQRVLAVRGGRM